MDRTETSFWAVWKDGLEWPSLYSDQKCARDQAHRLAKNSPGSDVHVMKIVSQGSVRYADKPEIATGVAA